MLVKILSVTCIEKYRVLLIYKRMTKCSTNSGTHCVFEVSAEKVIQPEVYRISYQRTIKHDATSGQ